jgi:hypothetical protein
MMGLKKWRLSYSYSLFYHKIEASEIVFYVMGIMQAFDFLKLPLLALSTDQPFFPSRHRLLAAPRGCRKTRG